jgi:hypothetical protein
MWIWITLIDEMYVLQKKVANIFRAWRINFLLFCATTQVKLVAILICSTLNTNKWRRNTVLMITHIENSS